ncbi:MAG: hypothetical protein AABW50_05440 [Nanoarchaeota archaeon]
MNKKAVLWIIAGFIVVAVVLIIALNGKGTAGNPQGQEEKNLPDVDEADYNTLQESSDDFAALDEAANLLE